MSRRAACALTLFVLVCAALVVAVVSLSVRDL